MNVRDVAVMRERLREIQTLRRDLGVGRLKDGFALNWREVEMVRAALQLLELEMVRALPLDELCAWPIAPGER
jgi:hypothetical protein